MDILNVQTPIGEMVSFIDIVRTMYYFLPIDIYKNHVCVLGRPFPNIKIFLSILILHLSLLKIIVGRCVLNQIHFGGLDRDYGSLDCRLDSSWGQVDEHLSHLVN